VGDKAPEGGAYESCSREQFIVRERSIAATERSPIGLWEILLAIRGGGREEPHSLERGEGVVVEGEHQGQLLNALVPEAVVAQTERAGRERAERVRRSGGGALTRGWRGRRSGSGGRTAPPHSRHRFEFSQSCSQGGRER
jgi:hypothetical protein